MKNQAGCPYVVSVSGKGLDAHDVHCNLIPAVRSAFCPKHVVITDWEKDALKRKVEKQILTRNLKIQAEEELKNSPIRAFNPDFDKKDRSYEQ
jgi:hypothetical protein